MISVATGFIKSIHESAKTVLPPPVTTRMIPRKPERSHSESALTCQPLGSNLGNMHLA